MIAEVYAEKFGSGASGGIDPFVTEELAFFAAEKNVLRSSIPEEPPSLFYISLESVRASALGAYNPQVPPELTPFLSDAVRRGEATVIDGLNTATSNTMQSL